MAKKDKAPAGSDAPFDLAARIGVRTAPPAPAETAARTAATTGSPRLDGPLPPRLDGPLPPRLDEPVAPRRIEPRPTIIGMDEHTTLPAPPPVIAEEEVQRSAAIPSPRTPPRPGETDIVATPLPTLDDWHRFELALRRVPGVGQVRTEYYRHGVLKVRVAYDGAERLAHTLLEGIPGYRLRIIGEDASTLQVLVSSDVTTRRPG